MQFFQSFSLRLHIKYLITITSSRIIELQKEITKTIATSKEADSSKEKLKAEVSKLKSNQSVLEKKIISKDER